MRASTLRKLNKKIKRNWDKLSDEELALYPDHADEFYNAVKHKYGMFKDDIERRIRQFKSAGGFFSW